jgi:hypothetical protein
LIRYYFKVGDIQPTMNGLLLDASVLLWNQIEPHVRNLKSFKNGHLVENLRQDDVTLRIFHFLHAFYCKIPYLTDPSMALKALEVSHKLSIIYESLHLYEFAVEVLKEAEQNVERIRESSLGSSFNFLEGVTCDLSFHDEQFIQLFAHQEDSMSQTRREFSAFHVDIHCSLYRCQIKVFLLR